MTFGYISYFISHLLLLLLLFFFYKSRYLFCVRYIFSFKQSINVKSLCTQNCSLFLVMVLIVLKRLSAGWCLHVWWLCFFLFVVCCWCCCCCCQVWISSAFGISKPANLNMVFRVFIFIHRSHCISHDNRAIVPSVKFHLSAACFGWTNKLDERHMTWSKYGYQYNCCLFFYQ